MERGRGARAGPVVAVTLAALLAGAGCTIAPKRFADLGNPAPLVRARAATMGNNLPPQHVVPALVDRLDDPDPVVRLTAHEELKRRTGRDFQFRPWDDPPARARAVARWRDWLAGRPPGSSARTVRPVVRQSMAHRAPVRG